MKKTATIISYHVFGTKNTNAIEITYKGKQLHHFMNNGMSLLISRLPSPGANNRGLLILKSCIINGAIL